MTPQLASDAIALDYGGTAVGLRPSLRAAIHLERLHGGFPMLLRKIEEFDTATIWHVITAGAGKEATDPIFAHAATHSLKSFKRAAQGPCIALVASFFPTTPDTNAQPDTATPTPWADLFKELYGFATGWLGWPPETAWNATPQEITDAFNAHIAKLKAIHGSGDDADTTGPDAGQRRENAALGLDPEFDRAGLRALHDLANMREGMLT